MEKANCTKEDIYGLLNSLKHFSSKNGGNVGFVYDKIKKLPDLSEVETFCREWSKENNYKATLTYDKEENSLYFEVEPIEKQKHHD